MQEDLICKGSLVIGSGCTDCSKCRQELHKVTVDTLLEQAARFERMDWKLRAKMYFDLAIFREKCLTK